MRGIWLVLLLVGCASAPPGPLWQRVDGLSAHSSPVLEAKAEADLAVCEGQRAAALMGASPALSGYARQQGAFAVMAGCMAERGYRPL